MAAKILIIEPHADDALLSCYSLLQNPRLEIDILTCCTHRGDRSSLQLVSQLESVKSVNKINFTEIDYLWESITYSYLTLYRYPQNAYLYQFEDLHRRTTFDKDMEYLVSLLSSELSGYKYIISPFGLYHPYHLLIHEVVQRISSVDLSYYCELNHHNKKSMKRVERDGLSVLDPLGTLVECSIPYNSKVKFEIFKKVYPSEMYLMTGDKKGHLEGELFYLTAELSSLIKESSL